MPGVSVLISFTGKFKRASPEKKKLLRVYSCTNPVTYSLQELCRKTSGLNILTTPRCMHILSPSHTLLLRQSPQRKDPLTVIERGDDDGCC